MATEGNYPEMGLRRLHFRRSCAPDHFSGQLGNLLPQFFLIVPFAPCKPPIEKFAWPDLRPGEQAIRNVVVFCKVFNPLIPRSPKVSEILLGNSAVKKLLEPLIPACQVSELGHLPR